LFSVRFSSEINIKPNSVIDFAHADHVPGATSLTAGLAKRAADKLPAYIIHTSGTGSLGYADRRAGRYGLPPLPTESEFSDSAEGITTLVSLPDDAIHREVDKIILDSSDHGVTTAIVAPPTISGRGRGPVNQTSVQWPKLAQESLKKGQSIQVGEGKNEWNYVHIQDLSDVYLAIIESALERIEGGKGKATWNWEGYYFAEVSRFAWGDVAKLIGEEGLKLGLFKTKEVLSLSEEETDAITPHGAYLWGVNSRSNAARAKQLFDWKPTRLDWKHVVKETVDDEALKLGLIKYILTPNRFW
jgi:nucleoside-diphosphate-sugar epimerase